MSAIKPNSLNIEPEDVKSIEKILDEAIVNGQDPENHAFAVNTAAQQIRQYIKDEIIGPDEPENTKHERAGKSPSTITDTWPQGNRWTKNRNNLRKEQRKKLREPME